MEKGLVKNSTKDSTRNYSKDSTKNYSKDSAKNYSKDTSRNYTKDSSKESAKETTIDYDNFLKTKEKRRKHFDKVGAEKAYDLEIKKGSVKKPMKMNLNQLDYEDYDDIED